LSRTVQSALKTAETFGDEARLTPFSQALTMRLLSAREAVMARMRPILRAHAVTEQQWRVLRILSGLAEIEITALSRLAILHAPSLTRILRDLLARGLVLRRSDEADMRRGLVSISPDGRALIEEVGPEIARAIREIDALYGPEQGALLRELLVNLEKVLGPGSAEGHAASDRPQQDVAAPLTIARRGQLVHM
jgi:homoprotocatechuate degradation regulator HpaR